VNSIYGAVLDAGMEPVVPIEERWYDVDVVAPTGKWNASGPMKAGNRQFVVADPDGYLLRLFEPRYLTGVSQPADLERTLPPSPSRCSGTWVNFRRLE
jgi:hypothetical protein